MPNSSIDTYKTKETLSVGAKDYQYYSLPRLAAAGFALERLPVSIRILLENLLRYEDGQSVTQQDIEAVAGWQAQAKQRPEIAFRPARVILQDFTGVPAVVDLAAMRDAVKRMGGDPQAINPLQPVDLVIDHSVQVDKFGEAGALAFNTQREFERNRERYEFLRWGQQAFANFRAVPPGAGIVHQVNLEYLARVVFQQDTAGNAIAYPDTLVGTDSHTTMINGIGVLGWGVGGIEAEAAMLGQPISMLVPDVVGFRFTGALPAGTTATDLVLMVVEQLRQKGVVGKFVEFFGPGLDHLSLADRATIANMAPEYGATMGFFPIDDESLNYLRISGRSEEQVQVVEAYLKAQGLFRTADMPEPEFTDVLSLDLSTVEASLAGPKRPQDRVALKDIKANISQTITDMIPADEKVKRVAVTYNGEDFELGHGAVTIAAITSCTNTSNPSVMIGAGLLAKKAVARGLKVKPWVKTSLAPGSKVVASYLEKAGLMAALNDLKFNVVGYGCTTCIGNSGPLPEPIAQAVEANNLLVTSVLSGNRNFEGRINPHVRANYLASPPLVVAYALAGDLNIDISTEPLGMGSNGEPVFLQDVWPTSEEIQSTIAESIDKEMFISEYGKIFDGDEDWQSLPVPEGSTYQWDPKSTYVKHPPFFEGMGTEAPGVADIKGAKLLALLGDSVTTDHISPAGAIPKDSPTTRYLLANGVEPKDFNSYGSRRGNHEVMMRGTFGNIRLRNQLAPGTEGGWTAFNPGGEVMSIYDAAMKYQTEGTPLLVIAGKEYGTGSSRDWAAKGTDLLGVKAVIAESFERIHRSNLIGMGVLPLQFKQGDSAQSLGITGKETFSIEGVSAGLKPGMMLTVKADDKTFEVVTRVDTPDEVEYCRHGGILQYVLRQIVAQSK